MVNQAVDRFSEQRRSGNVGQPGLLIQRGARQFIQQTIEAELATLLEQYDSVNARAAKNLATRYGYLPYGEIVSAGPAMRAWKWTVRDSFYPASIFNSNLLLQDVRVIIAFSPEDSRQRVASARGCRKSKNSRAPISLDLK